MGTVSVGTAATGAVATTDLSDAIQTNAEGPLKAAGDSGSMEQHSLTDQIEADKYLASKTAAATTGNSLGIRLTKLSPPGSV